MDTLHYTYLDRQQPVLVFLHGFLGSMHQWQYIEKELSENYSILKVDLPGHGLSPEFSKNYTLIDIAVLIDQILITEKIDQVHIIGHSMGGYLSAAFAKARPKKVSSITMINSIAGEDPTQRQLLRDRSIKLIEKHQEAYINMAIGNLFTAEERVTFKSRIEKMKEQAHHISITSIIQSLIAMRDRQESLMALKELHIPIVYLYGIKDEIISPQLIQQECELLSIEGKIINSGHMSLLTSVASIVKNMHFID
jgi:2-succinyl-6-hydroxy-2,4-cyclohexadiene-1-carboxylate synthase